MPFIKQQLRTQLRTEDESDGDTIEIEISDSLGNNVNILLFWDEGWTPRDGEEQGVTYDNGFRFRRP